MNLAKLFETQKALDEKIYDRFPGLKDESWDWKITALLTELGECANEHRGFKKWSANRQPNTFLSCGHCGGRGIAFKSMLRDDPLECPKCKGRKGTNPLLEEFVDCIHFFISLALELGIEPDDFVVTCDYTMDTATQTFNRVFSTVSSIEVMMDDSRHEPFTIEDMQSTLHEGFSCFVGLGEKFLDYTWEQIEEAYFEKNQINLNRQASGY